MRVIVLGAGVVGVTSAWYLAADGHEVTVIDRQPAPARETSHANGGQISVSHAEPWANPAAPWKALQWLGREDAPLLWRVRADPAQWAWGLRFLRQCTAARARANIRAIVGLGLHSRAALQALRRELALDYEQLERGILHFYTDAQRVCRALPAAARCASSAASGCRKPLPNAWRSSRRWRHQHGAHCRRHLHRER
jgi:D-amino-acid dehydrogenase